MACISGIGLYEGLLISCPVASSFGDVLTARLFCFATSEIVAPLANPSSISPVISVSISSLRVLSKSFSISARAAASDLAATLLMLSTRTTAHPKLLRAGFATVPCAAANAASATACDVVLVRVLLLTLIAVVTARPSSLATAAMDLPAATCAATDLAAASVGTIIWLMLRACAAANFAAFAL